MITLLASLVRMGCSWRLQGGQMRVAAIMCEYLCAKQQWWYTGRVKLPAYLIIYRFPQMKLPQSLKNLTATLVTYDIWLLFYNYQKRPHIGLYQRQNWVQTHLLGSEESGAAIKSILCYHIGHLLWAVSMWKLSCVLIDYTVGLTLPFFTFPNVTWL